MNSFRFQTVCQWRHRCHCTCVNLKLAPIISLSIAPLSLTFLWLFLVHPSSPMAYANELQSDGFEIEEPVASSSGIQDSDDTPGVMTGMHVLAATAASSARGIPSSPLGHIPSSPSLFSTSGTPSVLGRRERDLRADVWSPREKVRISEFARSTCVELGVPSSDRDEIVAYSQVSTCLLHFINHSCMYDSWRPTNF